MKEYCHECGKKLAEVDAGYFNTRTGERMAQMMCINPHCTRGCDNTGGHRWGLFSNKCKRGCGASLCDYGA